MTDQSRSGLNGRGADGVLAWIERSGNKLPDPVFIFLWCILAVIAISVVAALFGVSAAHPTQVDGAGVAIQVNAESLLSASNIQRLLVDMPGTFTGFHPLGYVLVPFFDARPGFLHHFSCSIFWHRFQAY